MNDNTLINITAEDALLSSSIKRSDCQEYSRDFNIADLTLVGEIGSSKATVFIGYVASSQKPVAVKVFPYRHRKINRSFTNESKFVNLEHPNIISYIHTQNKYSITLSETSSVNTSIIVMDLASQGDFLDVLITNQAKFDSKLARTYFHQLISAVEYMHGDGVAHQDLKLDNLLLDESFQLKICDFDIAWKEGQEISQYIGTANYRAPEVCDKACSDPKKADIYAAGILLFLFKCSGVLPHLEDQLLDGTNLRDLLHHNIDAFYQKHCELQNRRSSFFDEDFKQLFNGMVNPNPHERYTIEQVKNSKWYQGEIYSERETTLLMKKLLRK